MLVKMGGAALAAAVPYPGMAAQIFHRGLMNLYFVVVDVVVFWGGGGWGVRY